MLIILDLSKRYKSNNPDAKARDVGREIEITNEYFDQYH